jgi:DNA-binding FrmR family transcriptional regulator
MDRKPRSARAVDPAGKSANRRRLRRIEGQVRGILRMVEEERYCADILMQISSVQQALRGVARELMRNHLRHCATHTLQKGTKAEAAAMYEEILDLMHKHSR